MKHTNAPWTFKQVDRFDDLHKLRGTTPEPHEGYSRLNDGSWVVGSEGGRVASVDFKGSAKRGQAWRAPDSEGMANARLIACAPELLAALKALLARVHECGWQGSMVDDADAIVDQAEQEGQ